MLVDDRDPPDASPPTLPEAKAQLDPTVAGAKAQRRGDAVSAPARDAHLLLASTATASVIVGPRLRGSRREREHEQSKQQRTDHGATDHEATVR